MDPCTYYLKSKPLVYTLRRFTGFLLLLWPLLAFPQDTTIVYDGISGLLNVSIQNDTAVITTLIPESPADRAGLQFRDQIITINDSVVSGSGMNVRGIKKLLHDRAGTVIELKVKRKGEDELLTFSFQRDPYFYQIGTYDYLYLPDSLEQWDINDIMSDSVDRLFMDPLIAKITVFSVDKGSPAEKGGILPGDQIISLSEEVDKAYDYSISSGFLYSITTDTSVTLIRGDSLICLPLEPTNQGDLKGIQSQIRHDFGTSCVWLKIKLESRITEDRTYLLYFPEMTRKDSLNLFYSTPSGKIIEKKSGILFPVEDRDFIYKDWHAVTVPLKKGEIQTFYIRLKAVESVGAPYLQLFAKETIVNYDRVERMVLSGFLGTMLIISVFFIFLFIVIRERQYLYFALYIGSLAIFLFISAGYLDEFYWKENNFFLQFLERFQPYILSWVSVFFLLFGVSYLELRKTLKYWYISVLIVLMLTGTRILLVLFEVLFNLTYPNIIENIFTLVGVFIVVIVPLLILILPAIFRIRSGFRPAWFFLVSNITLIALVYITLISFGFNFSEFTLNKSMFSRIFISSGVYVAAVVQILIFTFGLAQKMRLDELEKKRIQQQIIDQLRINEKLKDKVNRELEIKVRERTREISEQKEEIESQRDEIEAQRDLVLAQKNEITDSIDYAERIQLALLPRKEILDRIMPEYFIMYKPKDILSGDFYWVKEVKKSLIIVSADCTGHGVPGAFMSILGITLLNEQLGKTKLEDPGVILDNLRVKIKEMLVQQGSVEEQKDGMDMAIAIIHKEKKELHFAGANHPLFLVRHSSQHSGSEPEPGVASDGNDFHLFELKGDRQPIGVYWQERKFTTHRMRLMDRDTLYVFTDGFIDQFGGERRKKFKIHRFKELLLSIQGEPMRKQKQLLEEAFNSWRGDLEQIDDLCVIGVRV
jgi:serine phosphatase RsbU (regulator of sigma subunit)